MATVGLGGGEVEIAADGAVERLGAAQVTVGIRPRAFAAASEPGRDTISALAELIEPMGAETLVHARSASGGDIRIVIPRGMRVVVGEALNLRPDPRQTHFFDADGKAVRT
jgi:multiple sugar transport system ATP-binding protein